MIAIVHSIYSQTVQAPALDARLMDNDAERYCIIKNKIKNIKFLDGTKMFKILRRLLYFGEVFG